MVIHFRSLSGPIRVTPRLAVQRCVTRDPPTVVETELLKQNPEGEFLSNVCFPLIVQAGIIVFSFFKIENTFKSIINNMKINDTFA